MRVSIHYICEKWQLTNRKSGSSVEKRRHLFLQTAKLGEDSATLFLILTASSLLICQHGKNLTKRQEFGFFALFDVIGVLEVLQFQI
ncbi:hypothetical protein GOODEAATRI_030416 [Goodea atripinnis]|uniref:Uncharacterized protein n=2 Tax=Goodeidae TaxID=28758 RepID=A0ABV0NYY7_9TELE